MYARFSIWAANLQEALADLGQEPANHLLALALYEEGESAEEAARYILSSREEMDEEELELNAPPYVHYAEEPGFAPV